MKALLIALVCTLGCGIAQATPIVCSGSILSYAFTIRANARGTRVAGPTFFSVTNNGQPFRHAYMRTLSSDIRPGRYLRFSAAGSEASGSIYAAFNPRTGYYTGTLAAAGRGQSTQVSVNCMMRGGRRGMELDTLFED